MPHTRRELQLPSAQVSYLEWMPSTAPRRTVVLLHGASVDCAQLAWGHLGPELAAAGHRVLAPDLPGFGESPSSAWTATQANLVACVAQFIDELELVDVTVGGISMGGGISLGYGLQYPERIHGLVIASSAGIAERVVDGAFSLPIQILTRLLIRAGQLDVGARWKRQDRQHLARSLTAVLRRPGSVTDEVLDLVSREVRLGHGSAANDQWQRSETLWNRARTVYTGDFPGFEKPVLILHGSEDTGVPVAAAERAARALPESVLVVAEGAGHWVTRDAPDAVLAALLQFLDR
ncbi:alpha/beta fold hydrolase [Streptomyces sp. cg2]|uniref:alpha/beta fold hydrolase n=1 Tax=Streptomyces sp. cg2 TaxID=3238799 RepID=UPI0034E24EE6